MKLLVIVLLALFVSASLTLVALDNPGYVLIAREPWSVEMSLAVFLVLLAIAVVVLSFFWHGLVFLWNTPREVAHWRRARRSQRSREAMSLGLVNLAERNWVQAEKQVVADIHSSPSPFMNYLVAAYAAQGQGNSEKRDEYLALAHEAAPDQGLTTGMAQAHLQLAARQYERALATLTQLRTLHPKNLAVLELLARCYRELDDWDSLVNLIPELRKRKALSPEQLDALEIEARRELLNLSLPAGAVDVLHRAWNAVPAHLRRQPELVVAYAQRLIEQNQMEEAESLIAATLERSWNDALARLYGLARGPRPAAQLETAEGWLATHSDRPTLLLTVGRLAARNQQPGKAREYLEKAILLKGPAEVHEELAMLFEQSGDKDRALEHYHRALEVTDRERRQRPVKPPSPGFPARRGGATAHYGY
ncbi:MAG TPA: heme biosynthesis HemY N-terminal domain-containing protein [Acidiferrobacterales bacterium]